MRKQGLGRALDPSANVDPVIFRFKICLFPFHASANSISEPNSLVFTGFSEV